MSELDRLNIEKLIHEKSDCPYRILLREFFGYDVPQKCPYRTMLENFFDKFSLEEKKGRLWEETIEELKGKKRS